MKQTTVKDLVEVLSRITGGRVILIRKTTAGGKTVLLLQSLQTSRERPLRKCRDFVWGEEDKGIKKIAVIMTMTESAIELAGATGVDAVVCHHPIADAANCGGVLLKTYLGLYSIAALELHEAFHGLHPRHSLSSRDKNSLC